MNWSINNYSMAATLHIEVGANFSSRRFDEGLFTSIINETLRNRGINAVADVNQVATTDFMRINGSVVFLPHVLIDDYNDYSALHNVGDEEYWRHLLPAILLHQPGVLFPDELLTGIIPFRVDVSQELKTAILAGGRKLVNELLSLQLSLNDERLKARLQTFDFYSFPIDWDSIREQLISAASSQEILIYTNSHYFDQLVSLAAAENIFELLRDGLFYEFGMKYPAFRFVFDETLPDTGIRFKVNNYLSLPYQGLASTEALINETVEKLKVYNIEARAGINPVNRNVLAIVNMEDVDQLNTKGYAAWDARRYLVLCLSTFLRKHGWVCLTRSLTEEYIGGLQSRLPRLAEMIRQQPGLAFTTHVLRMLVRNEISIRNLKFVLEAILESDYVIADGHADIIFDDRIPVHEQEAKEWQKDALNVVAFVRSRLKRVISSKYLRNQNTLFVYQVDPSIEKLVDPVLNPNMNASDEQRLTAALDTAFRRLQPEVQQTIVLTTVNARPHLEKVVQRSYPNVAVLAYTELTPDTGVQPIAKISLS
jgi:hypothetical protein